MYFINHFHVLYYISQVFERQVISMARADLASYRIRKIDLENNIERNGQVKINNTFSFSVKFLANPSTGEQVNAVATLTEIVKSDTDFSFTLTIEGMFKLADTFTEEDKREVHEICYDMLFPYAGQLVSNLVGSCGMPGLVLKKIPIKKESIRFGTPDTVS